MYHDRTAHDQPPLVSGQNVRILDNQTGKWKPATIKSKYAEPRSYILQLPDGSSTRRNRVQIRAAETSSYKQVDFNDHTTSLQKGLTNTNNISHQRSIKQPTCNTTRSGREILFTNPSARAGYDARSTCNTTRSGREILFTNPSARAGYDARSIF